MPTFNEYDLGDAVRVSALFTDANGAAADPTTVTLRIRKPDQTVETLTYGFDPAVIRSASGNYYADIDIDQEGTWRFRWTGTGTIRAAGESAFYIRDSHFS